VGVPQGIYVHIPFCKQACTYCNFHFSTQLVHMPEMAQAIDQEIRLRHNYLGHNNIDTIYFGGGTPGIMPANLLQEILDGIHKQFIVNTNAEITIEVNPDDMHLHALKDLKTLGFNRLSVGIQSFYEQDLKWMNRAHNSKQAEQCIDDARTVGFDNFSADLIYGFEGLSDDHFINNLNKLYALQVPHLSCYNLTVEPKTALYHQVQTGQSTAPTTEQGAHQFNLLMQWAAEHKYEHYEISNFALPNKQAVHNTNYWNNAPYLGLGPGAHSFNGNSRQWNIAHNAKYIAQIQEGKVPAEVEELTRENKINEYILTKLRTSKGLDISWLQANVSASELKDILDIVKRNSNCFVHNSNCILLSDEGKLFADAMAAQMFVEA
jgi:oxygen-independent coproporphyrinogen III oxidase